MLFLIIPLNPWLYLMKTAKKKIKTNSLTLCPQASTYQKNRQPKWFMRKSFSFHWLQWTFFFFFFFKWQTWYLIVLQYTGVDVMFRLTGWNKSWWRLVRGCLLNVSYSICRRWRLHGAICRRPNTSRAADTNTVLFQGTESSTMKDCKHGLLHLTTHTHIWSLMFFRKHITE